MNLGEFHTEMSTIIRRGTSVDDLIPGFVRRAARWIERNRSLQYMRQFVTLEIDPDILTTPQYVSLENTDIKLVRMFRWVPSDDSDYIYLKKCEPQDILAPATGTPYNYWLDGTSRIVLSATPTEVLSGELYIEKYSSWPTADASTHWLIAYAEDALLAQSMYYFGRHARDRGIMEAAQADRNEALITLLAAEQDSEWSDSDLTIEGTG